MPWQINVSKNLKQKKITISFITSKHMPILPQSNSLQAVKTKYQSDKIILISNTINLGSTSLLFLICVSPMVILHVTLSEENLSNFSYQVSSISIIKNSFLLLAHTHFHFLWLWRVDCVSLLLVINDYRKVVKELT